MNFNSQGSQSSSTLYIGSDVKPMVDFQPELGSLVEVRHAPTASYTTTAHWIIGVSIGIGKNLQSQSVLALRSSRLAKYSCRIVSISLS